MGERREMSPPDPGSGATVQSSLKGSGRTGSCREGYNVTFDYAARILATLTDCPPDARMGALAIAGRVFCDGHLATSGDRHG